MSTDRIHRALSADGTQIAARVHGQGPPLVLVPGGPGDGEFSFRFMLPGLVERFTCFCLSTRGKGLSADDPDHRTDRLIEDVCAVLDSIGEPVSLFGHSSGGMLALEAVARSEAVRTLGLYEPALFGELDDHEADRFDRTIETIQRLVDEQRLVDAARVFFEGIALANTDELEALARGGGFELAARNMATFIGEIQQTGPPTLSDPDLLGWMQIPVQVLRGTRTDPLFDRIARQAVAQLGDGHLTEIDGAGHLGPQLAGDQVAEALSWFQAPFPQG